MDERTIQTGLSKITIGEYGASIWVPEGTGPWPLCVLCGGEMEETLKELVKELKEPGYVLFAPEADWDRDYTPWTIKAPSVSGASRPGQREFAGKAGDYLDYLAETALPYLEREIPICPDTASRMIVGYSLGGLFALWAGYESGRFGGIASLSGSLWYEGWVDYVRSHGLLPDTRVYLSLGKSEEHSSNEDMRRVGDCTRLTYEHLAGKLGEGRVVLEWNRGGHFTGIVNRWKKALVWMAGSRN